MHNIVVSRRFRRGKRAHAHIESQWRRRPAEVTHDVYAYCVLYYYYYNNMIHRELHCTGWWTARMVVVRSILCYYNLYIILTSRAGIVPNYYCAASSVLYRRIIAYITWSKFASGRTDFVCCRFRLGTILTYCLQDLRRGNIILSVFALCNRY